MSPVTQFLEIGRLHLAYWVLMLISGIMLFSGDVPLLRKGLLLTLMGISLSGVRFTPFLVLIGPMLIAEGFRKPFPHFRKGIGTAVIAALMTAITGFYLIQYRSELFSTGIAEGDFPKAAVSFMKERGVGSRLFNLIEWGGYLQWHLPSRQVFIDGRVLRLDIWDEYFFTAVSPDDRWEQVLEKYRIDVILLPSVNPAHGEPLGLVPLLLQGSSWKPVFADETALIFVREKDPIRSVGRDAVTRVMIASLEKWAERDPENPLRWKRIGALLYQEGKKEEALYYYRKALGLKPDDPYLRNMVQLLGQ